MALWDWVLEAYARDGVPQAALRLQDEHGQNVSLLLWAAWLGTDDGELLSRGADLTRRWDAAALWPLRDVRRALKPAFAGVDDAARETLREAVKACEMQTEQLLVQSLESLAGARRGAVSGQRALRAACAAWDRPAPEAALSELAALLA